MSIVYLDDGHGGTVKTLRINAINVQIVNGLDSTNGYPTDPDSVDPVATVTNGLGNLIVGYNELGNPAGDDRTGSHNVVIGHGNSFSSFGAWSACATRRFPEPLPPSREVRTTRPAATTRP